MKQVRVVLQLPQFVSKYGVQEKLPAFGLLLLARRHSLNYVAVFINHDVVYKNRVTIYINHVTV